MENQDFWHKDKSNWKWGLFYFKKEDPRIIVPKPIEWMGITFNFGNPKSYLVLLVAVCFFGFIFYKIG